MPPPLDRVVLIHGIQSTGEWYESTAAVLEPWFEVVRVRYHEYERWGFPKVASDLGGIVIALVALVICLVAHFAGWWSFEFRSWPFAIVATLFVLGIILAILESCRRRKTENFVQGQLSALGTGRIHVIAHSFGTFQLGRALERLPLPFYDRIILIGCVLPRSFRWPSVAYGRAGNIPAFLFVRNEDGSHDRVVFLARLAAVLGMTRGVGWSGRMGFVVEKGAGVAHHRVMDPYGPCNRCPAGGAEPPILHDVELEKYDHGTMFLSAGHADALWLPVLWGMEPREHVAFVGRCCLLADALEDGNSAAAAGELRILRWESWSWTRLYRAIVSLDTYVRESIRARHPRIEAGSPDERAWVERAFSELAFIVRSAQDGTGEDRTLLYPKYAVGEAVSRAQ